MLKRVTNDFTGDLVNNSYQVTVNTAQELINAINQDPYADIVIKQDLDFSQVKPNSSAYTTLGTFSGRLDGQNHTIINLSKPLFNKLSLAYVQNLNINDGKSDGQDASAKLVAQAKPSAIFANVLSTTQMPTTQQTFTLNYVDVDNDSQVVHTTTVRGKVGEKVTVPNEVPTGYVALDQVPAEYTFTSDKQSVTVRLKHDTKQSTDQQDITRKINITNPQTGEVTTEQQTVTLTRQGTTDLVTGHTTYGDWSTGRLAAFQVPAFVGYTPVIMVNGQVVEAIDEVAVDYTTAPITVAVTYTAIAQETPQTTEIRYLDDDQNGQLVKVTSLKGKVDETVAVTIDVPTNYQLVGNVPTSYTFKATDNQPLAIHLTHKHQQAQATKTITRQLELLDPRTNTKTQQQQKVTLTLTKDTDLVTGKTTEAWTTGEWPAYQVPKLDGYTANLDQVVASTVDHTMEDQTVMIRYEANPQTSYIEYIDNDQSAPAKPVVLTLPLSGVTGQTVEVHYQTPTNYIVENPAAAVPTYTFSTHNLPIRIYLKHQISEIVKTKAVTRTINIAMPDQQQRVVKQTVTFKRTDHQDLVTKVTTEGDWQVDQVAAWSAYTIPEIPGYEANLTSLPAVVVTPTTADQTVNVAYQLKQQTVEVWYQDVDNDNSVVRVNTLQGTMGETVKVPISVPAYFDLVGTVPSTYTFKLENNDPIRIQVKHHKRTKQVVGEATRTIYVNYPDGHRDTITQVTNPKWTEVYDEATGRTTQEDRQNGEWAAFQAPEIPGYVASTPLIPQVAVFPQEGDVVATITYTAAPQSVTLVYVDDQTGKTVQTENLAGQTGQVVAVKVNIPENYRYQGGAPDTYLLKAENNGPIIIHLQHQTKVVLETHVANRTITIVFPDGTTNTMQDQQTIQRENVQDLVTGKVTPGHWSKANWAAVTIPVVADYTASQTTVPSEAILPTTPDQEITITYTANQKPLTHQVVTVQYQDTVTGVIIKTAELTGKVGETVAISINLPQGYLVQGTVPTSYTFTDQNEVIVIKLGHQTQASAETKTVTRTIKLTFPDHREQAVPQVVTLTRIKTTDQVTGEETFGPWSTATWTAYQIPTIPGFAPSLTQAPKQAVTALTDNQTLSVTYQAIPQATIIQYVDQTTGAVIATTSLNGKTGETVAIMPSAPTGYQLVGTVPATYTFNAADNPAVMIKVAAKDQSATTNPNGQAAPTDNATTPEPTKPNQDGMAHQSGVDQKQSATGKGANQIAQSAGQPVMDATPEITGLEVSDDLVADQTGNSKPVNGLPQTGNNPQVKLTVVGLIFASLSVLLGFGRKLTRKH
nr:ZmpA/ZmpB/ZmpC family metallo-endopeptidase-related protein [Lactobacillus sp. 3B(2020)]